ncbi:Uncharacterised protein [Yersinia intermedia]|nr:Uncharacterised protein [Yersinia intermedia]
MQIEMVKNAGGVFVPAFDHDLPRLRRAFGKSKKSGDSSPAELITQLCGKGSQLF